MNLEDGDTDASDITDVTDDTVCTDGTGDIAVNCGGDNVGSSFLGDMVDSYMTFSLEVEDKTGRVSETDGETDGLDCGDDNGRPSLS